MGIYAKKNIMDPYGIPFISDFHIFTDILEIAALDKIHSCQLD